MSIAIPRAQWGAAFGLGGPAPGELSLVVFHHFSSPDVLGIATPAEEMAALRGVERHHATPAPAGNGWIGIGYNFVVFASGRVYEGRGWGRVGAHAEGQNSKSVGVCFGWNGGAHPLTDEAIRATQALLAEGVDGGHLTLGYEIDGHRDHSQTDCPGGLIYPRLEELRPGAVVAATPPQDRVAAAFDALSIIEHQLLRIRAAL